MKLNFLIGIDIIKILKNDIEDFQIKKETLLNRIYNYIDKTNLHYYNLGNICEKESLQFTLNNYNSYNFSDSFDYFKKNSQGKIKKHDFIRSIIFTYSSKPKYEREKIIFKEILKKINYSIENKEVAKLILKTDGGTNRNRKVEIYSIEISGEERHNYVLYKDSNKNAYRAPRLSNIKEIYPTEEKRSSFDLSFVNNLQNNFEPFLSYGHKTKIKFTKDGLDKLERLNRNRPIEFNSKENRDSNIKEFYCNERHSIVYFGQFFNEIEILEPLELREKFKILHSSSLDLYK